MFVDCDSVIAMLARRFSLRTLLLVVALCALLFTAVRYYRWLTLPRTPLAATGPITRVSILREGLIVADVPLTDWAALAKPWEFGEPVPVGPTVPPPFVVRITAGERRFSLEPYRNGAGEFLLGEEDERGFRLTRRYRPLDFGASALSWRRLQEFLPPE
ncbi:MAG TPA: hypothetical protein VGE52_00145 [Pirellulales bacterium]